jgi:nitrogen regulatory protein PII-like uncharacterized protein
MKQTNIEKLIELLEVEYKAISPQGWENVIKERIIRSVIEKAKSLSQESDWVSVEEIVKDIHFLRDKAEHPLVKIAYNMAVTVVKSHYYKNTLPNKPKQ